MSGEEFMLLLPKLNERDDAVRIAERILEALSEPFFIDGQALRMSASIGMAFYPEDGQELSILMKKANRSMHQVKKEGRHNVRVFEERQERDDRPPIERENDLHHALAAGQFVLHYQPQYDLRSQQLTGTEALIRWNHPDLGLIPPSSFIPLAEENGTINEIGTWALREACQQNKAWQNAGLAPITVAVNLSARQFYQPGLVQIVSRILEETELEPRYLEVELTESIMIEAEQALIVLRALKALGVRISLDDFGVGFSSLSYLRKFPIDKLKIDKSFIQECPVDVNDATIVKTIISMAHNLKLSVIAEGVEDKDQLTFLIHHVCDGAQGFMFHKPIPGHAFTEKFRELQSFGPRLGLSGLTANRLWLEEGLRMDREALQEIIRLQEGFIFKVAERDGKLIHTFCDGKLLFRMGLVPEQIVGKEAKEFLTLADARRKEACYRRALQGEEMVSYESELNGIYYLTSLRAIRKGGEIVEIIGTSVDITVRRNMELALMQSEEKYRLLTDQMLELVSSMDEDGQIG
ncbi:EAL domain-containing protein [Paenibacillus methanolicus]|uniref:Diguanylate cyclase (GGDEF)-like protein n=1 Tax=Paenibacillus methanolicus TaxID=582686 RepID=A0A5S5CD07_9BACL|nr:EAL domain-containing protein [Paenibacillus methanolicus]TYP76392.1 diguanylate cyclase (GGDEF)-like protein [Paenibacillus methanolicus]